MSSLQRWINTFSESKSQYPSLEVFFIGEGVGESIILRIPGIWTAVVDAHGSVTASATFDLLQALGTDKIDAVFMSHCHYDHCSALGYILRTYPWDVFVQPAFARWQDLLKLLIYLEGDRDWKKTPIGNLFTYLGDSMDSIGARFLEWNHSSVYPDRIFKSFDGQKDAKLTIQGLAPFPADHHRFLKRLPKLLKNRPRSLDGNDEAEINLTSLVLRVEFGNSVLLLTGDSENRALEKIKLTSVLSGKKYSNLLLKVPHHSSKTSDIPLIFSSELSSAFSNRYAVTTPNTPHGLPDPEIRKKYLDAGYAMFQTGGDCPVLDSDDLAKVISEEKKSGRPASAIRARISYEGDIVIDTFGSASRIVPDLETVVFEQDSTP